MKRSLQVRGYKYDYINVAYATTQNMSLRIYYNTQLLHFKESWMQVNTQLEVQL